MEIKELLRRYKSGYAQLVNELKQLPEDVLHFQPSSQDWSVSSIIVHLADSEVYGFIRAKKIIAESGSHVMVYNRQIWAASLFYDEMNHKDALELIRILRKNLYALLKRLPAEKWNYYIFHPETGKITLKDWIQLYIDHIDIHIQQIHRNYYDWMKANEQQPV